MSINEIIVLVMSFISGEAVADAPGPTQAGTDQSRPEQPRGDR